MKRFALSTMLLALLGLTVGCGGGATTDEAAPEVETPAVEVDEVEEVETEEAPAE